MALLWLIIISATLLSSVLVYFLIKSLVKSDWCVPCTISGIIIFGGTAIGLGIVLITEAVNQFGKFIF